MANLVNSRKHAGMIVPYPVQEAMRVALGDDAHVQAQKDLYRGRRERIVPALESFGLAIHDSKAGLYLWATRGRSHLGHRGQARGPRNRRRARASSMAMPATDSSASR